MYFHPFDISIPHIIYACLGGFVVLFGMFSLFLRERLYIGEACWAFLFGVIIGPYCGKIFDPRSWGGGSVHTTNMITLEFTRVVLAIGVFAVGVELPKAYMLKHWRSIFFLLVPVMTYGWFVSAALIYAFIPGLSFLSSLAVASCLTPTDPILAAAVIGGKYADKHVPAHLRHLLAAESGCNDGAAFPFLFISLYLILDDNTGTAIRDWFVSLLLYQIVLATVFGSLIGFAFRHLMKFCERNDLIDRQSYVAQYVSLALLIIGTSTILGTDDLLAAFCCGTAFAWDGFFNKQTAESMFSSVIDLLFNVACFVYIGAWMPFAAFQSLNITVWRLVVIAILVLLLKRLPVMIALHKFIPDIRTFREAVFSGHFGPMGVGAVFIATLASNKLPEPDNPPANQQQLLAATIEPIVAFMVLCSILIHGLSIPFFSLGRHVHSVSRTWSMHGPPEWLAHTRRVSRAEDIVINQDSHMERGELSVKSGSGTPSDTILESLPKTDSNGQGTNALQEERRGELPPDGIETVTEWKEGNHKIIERRAGPGEEVEVEVHRNAYGSSNSPKATSSFKVAEHSVRHAVGEYLRKFHHPEHDPEASATHSETTHHGSKKAMSPTLADDDDEGGWASDEIIGSSQESVSDSRMRSRSQKQKSLVKKRSSGSTSSRRHSKIKRMSDGFSRSSQNFKEVNNGSRRDSGDRPQSSRRLSDDSRVGSLRNLRLEIVRNMEARSPREQSPSRSVRFVDDEGISSSPTPVFPLEG